MRAGALDLRLFALDTNHALGVAVANELEIDVALHEERAFEDGEHKIRPMVSVRGQDIYVVQSLFGDAQRSVNDKLIRLLFFIGALRDASAARITAVIPYLAYARKDARTKSRDPISNQYLAQLVEAVGADRILALDVHNPAAYQNAYRIPAEHLEAQELFVSELADYAGEYPMTVVSPDIGGIKRAEALRLALESRFNLKVGQAFMEKYRSAGVISGENLVGEVNNRDVVIVDDLISTGATLVRAAQACKNHGAKRVIALASHGVFASAAGSQLASPAVDLLLVTDSVPFEQNQSSVLHDKLQVIATAPLFAQAIATLNREDSLTDLLVAPQRRLI